MPKKLDSIQDFFSNIQIQRENLLKNLGRKLNSDFQKGQNF